MADFGSEYSSQYAYFIAGGKTLEAIKKYESDKVNAKQLLKAIGDEYGAQDIFGYGSGAHLTFDKPVNHPALKFSKQYDSGSYVYDVDPNTPEGQALLDRIGDIPQMEFTFHTFAKRMTGKAEISTNPDHLRESYGSSSSHYRVGGTAMSAMYRKYGETYVIEVPRIIRGVFNDASKKASEDDGYTQAAGYTYEWWSPPDSTPIPYSKTIELREQALGDQLNPASVTKKVPAYPDRR